MNEKNIYLVIGIFFVIMLNSIIYGALNTDMFIDGDVYVRVDRNIRVTGIKVLEQTNGAYETYNCDYSKDTTSIQATLPSSDSSIVYEVTITNKGDIDYEVTSIAEESYSNNNIKYEIIDLEKGTVIDGETTYVFKIKLTTTENDSENKGMLVLKYTFEEWVPSLYNMVAYKSRSLDTDVDFGVEPTKETSGVYEMNSTKDDEYPVYYYRGIVENNNVSFAGFCWKMVRTTSTGGVKLIYNGVPSSDGSCDNTGASSWIESGAFNTSLNSLSDVSYVYENGSDSEIKKTIDTWYFNNIVEYTDMLEDTVWCNDRSIYNVSGSYTYFGAYGRNIDNHTPSLVCPNDSDKNTVSSNNGNGLLSYPVALLTADEVTLAGSGYNSYTTLGYLYIGDYWWLMSPFNFYGGSARSFFINEQLSYHNVIYSRGIRPSISLVSGTMINEGNGSVSKPYKLVEDRITKEWTFDYTGGEQEFKVPYDGVYKIETWGAGVFESKLTVVKGYGGYTSGEISLNKSSKLYIHVGGQGKDQNSVITGGYNGGGDSTKNSKGVFSGTTGGGATDVRLISGSWDNFDSLKSRIMVAAGGSKMGIAGGITGTKCYFGCLSSDGSNMNLYTGNPATQTSGGAAPTKYTVTCIAESNGTAGGFGFGGKGGANRTDSSGGGGAGGGSGYYGGSGGSGICNGVLEGGGGSSFVSGHNGCDAIKEESTASNIIHTGQSVHYSGYSFKNTKMIDGAGYNWTTKKEEKVGIPSYDGEGIIEENNGNGYAKITLISKK